LKKNYALNNLINVMSTLIRQPRFKLRHRTIYRNVYGAAMNGNNNLSRIFSVIEIIAIARTPVSHNAVGALNLLVKVNAFTRQST